MDAEAGLKDVELNEAEAEVEKQPMTADGSNGALKAKALGEEEAAPFAGLSKEELLQVANTPGWVRLRWALLLLFWLGWLAMLAGAVLIIVRAPRCQALPDLRWWQRGAVYQLAVDAFQDSRGDGHGDLAGVEQRLDSIVDLKVKGIVIGPIHRNAPDQINGTKLTEIESDYGTMEQFDNMLAAAHRKGLKVILDLTPNYRGEQEWFGIDFNTTNPGGLDLLRETEAFRFWLQRGVDGLRLGGIEQVLNSVHNRLVEWQNLTRNFSADDQQRVLIAATAKIHLGTNLQLLNQSDVDLLFSDYLRQALSDLNPPIASAIRESVEKYINGTGKLWPSWAVGGPKMGHMMTMNSNLIGLLPVMLFTLPGTPFTYYGDEIGLQDDRVGRNPWMLWNSSENAGFTSKLSHRPKPSLNQTVEQGSTYPQPPPRIPRPETYTPHGPSFHNLINSQPNHSCLSPPSVLFLHLIALSLHLTVPPPSPTPPFPPSPPHHRVPPPSPPSSPACLPFPHPPSMSPTMSPSLSPTMSPSPLPILSPLPRPPPSSSSSLSLMPPGG